MVYNGILMETTGTSVMVSFGLLLFFFSRRHSSIMTFILYKRALENITGLRLHLETKQRHSYILRSISASFS